MSQAPAAPSPQRTATIHHGRKPAIASAAPVDFGWSDLGAVTELMRFAMPGNLTGLPAIAFPVGYDERGLPTGMQAMGRPWEEHLLLRIAALLSVVYHNLENAMRMPFNWPQVVSDTKL